MSVWACCLNFCGIFYQCPAKQFLAPYGLYKVTSILSQRDGPLGGHVSATADVTIVPNPRSQIWGNFSIFVGNCLKFDLKVENGKSEIVRLISEWFHFTNWSIFSQAGPLSKVVRFDQPPCKMILRCKSLKSFDWNDFWHQSDGLNYSAVWVPEPSRYWAYNFLICIFLGSRSAP